MKKYNILMSQEIAFRMSVEAESEEEAIEKCHSDLNDGEYLLVDDEKIDRQEVLEIEEVEE